MGGETRAAGEIFIVDDDPAICTTLSIVFSRAGYQATCFSDGASLLAATRVRTPACIVLDVHIPGRSGLDILRELNAENYPAPIFMMSGQGDIPMAVDAIRHGAFDFVEKPFRGSEIVVRVREAIEALARRRTSEKGSAAPALHLPPGRELLTPRESEVLEQVVAGASNKEAGRQLGISPRTIEVHRARIMEKLGAKNTADLIRIEREIRDMSTPRGCRALRGALVRMLRRRGDSACRQPVRIACPARGRAPRSRTQRETQA